MTTDVSHSQIIMWTVTFFFGAMGMYSVIFWLLVRGLKKQAADIKTETAQIKQKTDHFEERVDQLDKRKVDFVIYMDEKESARKIITSLQTKERCEIMQNGRNHVLSVKLDDLKEDIGQVLENQKELMELRGTVDMIKERQNRVITRLDDHLNGNK